MVAIEELIKEIDLEFEDWDWFKLNREQWKLIKTKINVESEKFSDWKEIDGL